MRALVLVVATSCGRIAFDATPRAADGGDIDATPAVTRYFMTSGDTAVESHLVEVDPATGEVTDLGSLGNVYPLGGLAMWDANTLYAPGKTSLHQITLSPLSMSVVADVGGSISCLERDGDDLLGVDQNGDSLVRIPIASMTPARTAITAAGPISASGGDIVRLSTGTWLWYTNATRELFRIDPVTAVATRLGGLSSSAFISGLTRDDSDRLFMTASGDDSIIEVNPANGAVLDIKPLCSPCPTGFDLLNGDTTRTP
jgi:hypothetical protein